MLASKVNSEPPVEATTPVAPEAPVEEPAQPTRNADGTFAVVAPAVETTPDEGGEQVTPSLIAGKFDPNDPDVLQKIAASYAELEKVVGRQSTEVNEARQVRENLARLEGQLQAIQAQQHQAPSAPLSQDTIDEMVSENPVGAALQAIQRDDRATYDRIIESWHVDDPIAAQRFDMDRQFAEYETQKQMAEQQHAATRQPHLDTQAKIIEREAFNEGWRQTATQYPDLEQYKQEIGDLFETRTDYAQALTSGNPQVVSRALSDLRLMAMGMRNTSLAAAAATQAQTAAVEAKRAGAAVASGSLRPATEGQTDTERVAGIKAFKEAILSAGSTSIDEGLVIPGQGR